MLRLHVALLAAVLCSFTVTSAANSTALIFFNGVPENIYEGRTNNSITLVRFISFNESLTINYTVSGIGISSPDDFTGGDFSIVYPPTSDPLKIPIDFKDNSVCDGSRTIVVRITAISNGANLPDTSLKHFIVIDDDGEWTEWDTSEGLCNCETAMRDRFRNRTCNNKGIPGRTCDGPATINDTVPCADDPACSTTTTPTPTTTTTTATTTTTMTTTTTATTTPTSTPTTTPWSAWSPSPPWRPPHPWGPWPRPWRPRPWGPSPWGPRPWRPFPWRPHPYPWGPRPQPQPWPQPNPGPTEWSQWVCGGPCSATCNGILSQSRNRTCTTGSVITETRTVTCSHPCLL